jgi:hypothetical protein
MATYNRPIQVKIMKRIKIKDPGDVYFKYMFEDRDLMDFIDNRNAYCHYSKGNSLQNGAGIVRKLKYTYGDKKFKLYEIKLENGYDISVHRNNDMEDPETCLHILINQELHLAYINNISYYKNCVSTNLEHPGGGGILLKMCIQFLKDTKDRYQVNRIQLKDNSMFTCFANKEKIMLPVLHTLLYGDTWYGKYGFRPYNPDKNIEDEKLAELYDQNKIIITTTKTKDTNIFNYLYVMLDGNNSKENKKRIDRYYDKYKNCTIDVFFRKFMMDFQKSCVAIHGFYLNFYTSMRLYDFTHRSFYLNI